MKSFLLALAAALLIAGAATADIPPPAPPKGKRYIAVNNEVVLGKDVTGYVFVQQTVAGPGAPKFSFERLELTPEKAKALPPSGRRSYVTIVAVRQDAAKEYKTDDELFDAVKSNKVKGAHRIDFTSTATVSDRIKGDTVKWTTTITAIDPKTGIKTKVEGEGYEAPKAPGAKEKPPVQASVFVAGGSAALAVLLGGLWLAGRGRRKV